MVFLFKAALLRALNLFLGSFRSIRALSLDHFLLSTNTLLKIKKKKKLFGIVLPVSEAQLRFFTRLILLKLIFCFALLSVR